MTSAGPAPFLPPSLPPLPASPPPSPGFADCSPPPSSSFALQHCQPQGKTAVRGQRSKTGVCVCVGEQLQRPFFFFPFRPPAPVPSQSATL